MTATGIGSLPGDDIDAAVALVFDALPDLPHLPELPARGPGADMVGRSAAALIDLHVDLQPAGWRLVPRASLDERRAADLLDRDLDALVPVATGYGGAFKVQLAGPWTLASTLELPRGGPALGDVGAVNDLVGSLAEAARWHLAEVARRLPGAQLMLQLDEPALAGVLAGTVPTQSGFGRLTAVDAARVRAALAEVMDAVQVPVVVHTCAPQVPVTLLREAGATAVSFDLSVARMDLDELADAVERGLALWLGIVPALGPGVPPTLSSGVPPILGQIVDDVRQWWHRLGFGAERLPGVVTVTPACGLSGASQGWARTALDLVRRVDRALAESTEAAPA